MKILLILLQLSVFGAGITALTAATADARPVPISGAPTY